MGNDTQLRDWNNGEKATFPRQLIPYMYVHFSAISLQLANDPTGYLESIHHMPLSFLPGNQTFTLQYHGLWT
jgi:hypothetical protein